MRVLFATTHIHLPQGTGGIEVTLDALCKTLLRRGIEVCILCRLHPNGLFGWRQRIVRKAKSSDIVRDTTCGYQVYRGWNPVQDAKSLIRSFNPDIVLTQGWMANELARPFVLAGIPTLISIHTPEPFEVDTELLATGRLHFLANSQFTRTLHGNRNFAGVIPPLIRWEDYRVDSTRKVVLFVNPIATKGLKIAVSLARARPDIGFDFVESWRMSRHDRQFCREEIRGLVNVRWHRAVSDMREAYRRARIILMPSVMMETWGRVASEGHISGIPTLGSAHGALPDTIGPAGICVSIDGSFVHWERALCRLWDDPVTYESFRTAAERHSLRPEIEAGQVEASFIRLLTSLVL